MVEGLDDGIEGLETEADDEKPEEASKDPSQPQKRGQEEVDPLYLSSPSGITRSTDLFGCLPEFSLPVTPTDPVPIFTFWKGTHYSRRTDNVPFGWDRTIPPLY